MMNRALITILFITTLALLSAAQQSREARLNSSKPTIYLGFERLGEDDSVWLRLHNNSLWAISFRTEDSYAGMNVTPLALGDGRQGWGLVDELQIVPEYFVEHATERVTTNGQNWCTASTSWLPSGHSVTFSFPRRVLREWEQIYIRFGYEWESGGYDPEHRVQFYGVDLQRAINADTAPNNGMHPTPRHGVSHAR
jgi:hypothetical protein